MKNTITAAMDEFFPEYAEAFKCPLAGTASRRMLKVCPFPKSILGLGVDGVTEEIRKAVRKTVGRKKAAQLAEAAKGSIGADYGGEAAGFKPRLLLEELELLEKHAEELEVRMAAALQKAGYAEFLPGIKGIGVVTLAACMGEAWRSGKV